MFRCDDCGEEFYFPRIINRPWYHEEVDAYENDGQEACPNCGSTYFYREQEDEDE